MRWVWCALLLAVGIGGWARSGLAAGPEPQLAPGAPADAVSILLKTKKVYQSCRSYRDSGEVQTRGFVEGGSFASTVRFATAFVRPGALRFEFTVTGFGERAERWVMAWDGSRVLALTPTSEVRVSPTLGEALDGASGITAGASLRVPGMLLPRVVGGGALLVSPERLEDELEAGRWCYKLRGQTRATPYERSSGSVTVRVEEERVTLWIDRESCLLRKVEEEAKLSTYRSVITTTYTPELDVEIPAGELALPPLAPPQ